MRKMHRLNGLVIKKAGEGMHPDGGGLYLQVTNGSKSWIYRFAINKRERHMGLGSLLNVSLQEAREKAAQARKLASEGIDPIAQRDASRAAAAASTAKLMTFAEVAEKYVAAHEASWSNAKHRQQWHSTLHTYVLPAIGKLSMRDIDTGEVIKIIEPLWRDKTETATRVRGRIESVLDYAKVRGWRDGENPARWRGHLDHLLPKRSKVQRVEHLAAMPYRELPEFMGRLRGVKGVVATALEFTILTAARTDEVLGATWGEIEGNVWIIPADRMKAKKEHRVPLSNRALAILGERGKPGDLLFSGSAGKLHGGTMRKLLRRLGRDETTHGFRSTFSDWAAEQTAFANEVREMALAHTISNKVEGAYRRGDLFEKRQRLMNEWAKYCLLERTVADVVPLRG